MKNFLAILAVVAVFVTISEAGYSCDNWKKMDGPCEGCVFTSGDMEGKCKRTGKYFNPGNCEAAGGTWCNLSSRKAGYSCDNWKKMDGPCPGCVFTSGDMEGKCKRTGQYFNEGNCVESGGTWCTLRLKFQSISIFLMITCA